jgi:hypothetical protein
VKYRKKPLVIEARQFTGPGDGPAIAGWCGGEYKDPGGAKPLIVVHTLEGEMVAFPGDWVIHGVIGEFYPCKPEVFAATYEPAEAGEES